MKNQCHNLVSFSYNTPMKKHTTLFVLSLLVFLTSCSQKRPSSHPLHPHYEIKKPKVKYTPSKKNLAKMVKKLQGSPYVWAEEGPNNFDCSGFTYYMYGSMGIEIPRVARNQAKVGKRIPSNALQYGDLIFFATNKRNLHRITHVGMYLGDGWFTHASTVKHEVVYSNLFTSSYYKKRLRVCRRYLPDDSNKISIPTQQVWKVVQKTSKKVQPFVKSVQKRAIVIKAPIHEIEKSSVDGNYYVQIGSFIGSPKHALIYHISQEGLHHKIIQFQKDGQQISKLLIGPYFTRNEALAILPVVREKIQKDAFIAEIR